MDRKGMVLTSENPYYAIQSENLRDFKLANKYAITKGLIMETTEPSIDWDVTNAISDEQAEYLLKNFVALKNELPKITSLPTVEKLLRIGTQLDRPTKTMKLIDAKLEEFKEEQEIVDSLQRGV